MAFYIFLIGAIGIGLIIVIELIFDGLFFKWCKKQDQIAEIELNALLKKTENEFFEQLKPFLDETKEKN
ncbi:Uncharacterised protein [Kingella potus]|uniref:Uncharacterized protein n=1 Tax=Kingella potus TaxID=265175 RepID=A0A377QYJ9_9NEIS|nr:hypothetical protein [Kingella potus]UOP01751.1 hypothetical protein LVJ84_06460 [Kingella potus]STQ99939.1 Uncharacterised protein [Kingella potus]